MINKTYRNNFKQFIELLNLNKIPYCLVCGTLLGAIRKGDFIKYDEDIDIGIPVEYMKETKKLIESINSDWYYFCIWRREFSIVRHCNTKAESKIDIFFFESDDNFTYLYSYLKNPMHGHWDIEWRMKFPKELFSQFTTLKMDDIIVSVPLKSRELLKETYGPNWRLEDPNWDSYATPCYDKEYREIAIVIPTFMRDIKLFRLIDSIKNTLPVKWYKIYIGDQGFYDTEKTKKYDILKKDGHYTTYLPFNSGLSFTRNYLVSKVQEPYILLLDDDFLLTKDTNIKDCLTLFSLNDNLGVVGGNLESHQAYNYNLFLDKINKKLYYIDTGKNFEETKGTLIQKPLKYRNCDIVLNFSLIKTELFKDIKWDNELKMAEHTDFYLRLKQSTKWEVAYLPSLSANHQKEKDSDEYTLLRRGTNDNKGLNFFLKKWDLKTYDNDIVFLKEIC